MPSAPPTSDDIRALAKAIHMHAIATIKLTHEIKEAAMSPNEKLLRAPKFPGYLGPRK